MSSADLRRPGAADLGRGRPLRLCDRRLVLRARDRLGLDDEGFTKLLAGFGGVACLDELDRAGFDGVAAALIAFGFRDPELPHLSRDYLGRLRAARRDLGISDREWHELLQDAGGVSRLEHIRGLGFLRFVSLLVGYGFDPNRLGRSWMTRQYAGVLQLARRALNITDDAWYELLAEVGGVVFARDLDERGFLRLTTWLAIRDFTLPTPPPRVELRPGFVTQAQANLIWKLWHDHGGVDADLSDTALDGWLTRAFGLDGGLRALTQSGVRVVIGHLIIPRTPRPF